MDIRLLICCIAVSASLMVVGMDVQADTFVEKNQKINTIRESGFGPEGKAESFAGIKLDTKEPLAAGCAWDVIAFDPSTEAGKKTLKELNAVLASKGSLKSISYTKDTEGDCYLEKYEK